MKKILCLLAIVLFSTVLRAQTAEDLMRQARGLLAQRDAVAASAKAQAALALAPNDPNANVLAALTRLAALSNSPEWKTLLDRLGFDPNGRNIYLWTSQPAQDAEGEVIVPQNFSAQELTRFMRTNLIPTFESVRANLAKVTSPTFEFTLTRAEMGSLVALDYGDIQVAKAMLSFAQFMIYTFSAWNIDVQLTALRDFLNDEEATIEEFLSQNANFLTFTTTDDLQNAKGAFVAMADQYFVGSDFIRARKESKVRLFNVDVGQGSDEAEFRQLLTQLKSSLTAPVVLVKDTNLTVNLGKFFSQPKTPRSLLPMFRDNSFIVGSVPDITFGGVLTGAPKIDVEDVLSHMFAPGFNATRTVNAGVTQVVFPTLSERSYAIERSLNQTSWTEVGSFYSRDSSFTFNDTTAPSGSTRFYRLVELDDFVAFSGLVNDPCSGQPVANALISSTLDGRTTTTDANGFYFLQTRVASPPSSFDVKAEKAGYQNELYRLSRGGDTLYDYVWFTLQANSSVAPANDAFASRMLLAGAGPTASGTTCGATREGGEPSGSGGTIWFQWTPPISGEVEVNFDWDRTFDYPNYEFFSGNTLGSLNRLSHPWRVTAGQPVQIRFSGSGSPGFFKFTLAALPTVTITEPEMEAEFSSPSNVRIRANFSDPSSALKEAVIYINGDRVATLTAPPFEYLLQNAPPDFYWVEIETESANGMYAFDYRSFVVYPANDDFSDAASISGSEFSVFGDNSLSSREPSEPSDGETFSQQTVWYKWVAPASGPVTLVVTGDDSEFSLGVYTGSSLGSLNLVASGYDNYLKGSSVSFQATAGTTYRIVVGNEWEGEPFQLSLVKRAAPQISIVAPAPAQRLFARQPLDVVVAYNSAGGLVQNLALEARNYESGDSEQLVSIPLTPAAAGSYTWRLSANAVEGFYDVRASVLDNAGLLAYTNFYFQVEAPSGIRVVPPTGFGGANFVKADALLSYRIDFENPRSASSAVQAVVVTDALPNTLDWSTLQIGEVAFGDRTLVAPAGAQQFATVQNMTYMGVNFEVRIDVSFNPTTGVLTARYESINPATGLPPTGFGSIIGFLPPEPTHNPNDTPPVFGQGRGQGHVSFKVRPKAGLATGTQIRNVATVKMDNNAALPTDLSVPGEPGSARDPNLQALVTLDANRPESSVAALPANTPNASFNVSWSGTDGGAGLVSFNVFVSTNNGPWILWQANTTATSATFTGQSGSSYGFYSVALDGAGNSQIIPATPQATTRIQGETVVPQVVIKTPLKNARFTNPLVTIQGTASDNVAVAAVEWRFEGSSSYSAANGTTAWTAEVNLVPGANTIRVRSRDTSGNVSAEAALILFYDKTSVFHLNVVGRGTVTPNLNDRPLIVGSSYTITAAPAPGFAFQGWTGPFATNKTALKFTMLEALTETATFIDIAPPTLTIAKPTANQRVTNEVLTISGTAKDNDLVRAVTITVNGVAPVEATGTNIWQANVALQAGLNTIRVVAEDFAGKRATNSVTVTRVVTALFVANVNPVNAGTIAPNLSGQNLEIDKAYTITATAKAGFAFTGWTGSIVTNKTALKFTMVDGLTETATFIDIAPPSLTIAKPTANQRVTNEVLAISGTAKDNDFVRAVTITVNGVAPVAATGTNTWQANVALQAGLNTILVVAEDFAGKRATNSVTVTRVVTALFVANVNPVNAGTIAPNLSGQNLEIDKAYTITATAKAGFAFTGWTGSIVTNKTALAFKMKSGQTATANFRDSAIPTVTIVAPKAGAIVTNETVTIRGTAADNGSIANVFYRVDGGSWQSAGNGTNWAVTPALMLGVHTMQVYAMDGAENRSKTNSVTFTLPTYAGLYLGTLADPQNANNKGFGGMIVRSNRSALLIGGNSSFDDGFAMSQAFNVRADGSFDFTTDIGGRVKGKITATGANGTFDATQPAGGVLAFPRKADTGAKAASAGYYQGTYTLTEAAVVEHGAVKALLAADGQLVFAANIEGSFEGGAGKGTINAANLLTAAMGTDPVTGSLTPATQIIVGNFARGAGHFELHREFTTAAPLVGLLAGDGGLLPDSGANAPVVGAAANQALAPGADVRAGAVELVVVSLDSQFAFTFNTSVGREYSVQVSHDLETWSDVATFTAEASEYTYAHPVPAADAARFFRVTEK